MGFIMRMEDALICELCKSVSNRTVIEDILARESLNIELVLARTNKHLVMPLVLSRLMKYPLPERIGSRIASSARQAVLETALRNQLLKKEHARIRQILEKHGIEYILMKGLSLDFTGMRTMGDLDILVRERDLLHADKLVPAAGFEYVGDILNPLLKDNEKKDIAKQLDWNNQFQYYNRQNRILLELHTNLFERSRVYDFDLTQLLDNIGIFWSRKRRDPALGAYVLSNEDLLLLMCLHTALKRSPYSNRFILRNILDIAALVERGIDWMIVAATSRDLNLSSFVYFSLRFSRELLGVEIPDGIIDELYGHCTAGEKMIAGIHFKCFRDLGSNRLVFSNLYKILVPFVYQKKWLPRIKRLLLVHLLFPPKRTMAAFFNIKAESPLVYATYLLNPIRLLYLIGRRIAAFFK